MSLDLAQPTVTLLPPGWAIGAKDAKESASARGYTTTAHWEHTQRDDAQYEPCRAETALWRAVIVQAVQDARSNSKKPEAATAKAEAMEWFTSEDFRDVCIRANLCPDTTYRKIMFSIENNTQWRLPAGQGWRAQARKLAEMETVGNA